LESTALDSVTRSIKQKTQFTAESQDPNYLLLKIEKWVLKSNEQRNIIATMNKPAFNIKIQRKDNKLEGNIQMYMLAPDLYLIDFVLTSGDHDEWFLLYRAVYKEFQSHNLKHRIETKDKDEGAAIDAPPKRSLRTTIGNSGIKKKAEAQKSISQDTPHSSGTTISPQPTSKTSFFKKISRKLKVSSDQNGSLYDSDDDKEPVEDKPEEEVSEEKEDVPLDEEKTLDRKPKASPAKIPGLRRSLNNDLNKKKEISRSKQLDIYSPNEGTKRGKREFSPPVSDNEEDPKLMEAEGEELEKEKSKKKQTPSPRSPSLSPRKRKNSDTN